jgi:hypothetical protein
MISRFGMISLSVLPLLIFTLIMFAAARAVILAITAPRRGVRVPSCERCHYPVAGLAALACPECGTDLRSTGIITLPMEMRRRGSTLGAITWLTVLCLMLALLAFYASMLLVGTTAITATTSVTTTTLTPASAAYRSISFEQNAGGMVPVAATLNLNDGTTRRLEVQTGGRAVLKDGAGAEFATAQFDETVPTQLFAQAGISTSDPVVAVELADLTRIIDQSVASPWSPPSSVRTKKLTIGAPTFTTGTGGGSAVAEQLSQLLAFAIPLVIWVFGTIFIVYRRKRMLREAAAADGVLGRAAPSVS